MADLGLDVTQLADAVTSGLLAASTLNENHSKNHRGCAPSSEITALFREKARLAGYVRPAKSRVEITENEERQVSVIVAEGDRHTGSGAFPNVRVPRGPLTRVAVRETQLKLFEDNDAQLIGPRVMALLWYRHENCVRAELSHIVEISDVGRKGRVTKWGNRYAIIIDEAAPDPASGTEDRGGGTPLDIEVTRK